MVTTVCWVRHGETRWNREGLLQGQEDVPLNERGRSQAQACARHLAALHWDAIVSSPLARARGTASIIAQQAKVGPPALWDALMERSYGEGEGLCATERQLRFPDGVIPGVEPYAALGSRVQAALERLTRDYAGQRVLVVAHGGTINGVMGIVTHGAAGTVHVALANCSLSWTVHDGERWTLGAYNQRVDDDPWFVRRAGWTAPIGDPESKEETDGGSEGTGVHLPAVPKAP